MVSNSGNGHVSCPCCYIMPISCIDLRCDIFAPFMPLSNRSSIPNWASVGPNWGPTQPNWGPYGMLHGKVLCRMAKKKADLTGQL